MTPDEFARRHGPSEHAAGCTYGGFSCGYWLISPGCTEEHWEEHIVGDDDTCPCGHVFPGAGRGVVFCESGTPPSDEVRVQEILDGVNWPRERGDPRA
jgi:hypothetical protein